MHSTSIKPFKICREFGCDILTKDSYCKDHEHIKKVKGRLRLKDYNANRRNTELHSFYNGKDWLRVRVYRLVKDNYLCQICFKGKRMTKADLVHHIKYLEHHPELSLDINNLISLCHSCHNKIHAKD